MAEGIVKKKIVKCVDCGKERLISIYSKNKRCHSCAGKINATTHGKYSTKLYKAWSSMKSRCLQPNYKNYKNWGGRGIKVCDDWLKFTEFLDWAIHNGYKDGLTLDRIDNDGNYEPSNCQWITKSENCAKGHGQAKLTKEEVTEIRKRYSLGTPVKELSVVYGISSRSMYDIVRGVSYRW